MSQAAHARVVFCAGLFALVGYAAAPVQVIDAGSAVAFLPSAERAETHSSPALMPGPAGNVSLFQPTGAAGQVVRGDTERWSGGHDNRPEGRSERIARLADALSAALAEQRRFSPDRTADHGPVGASDRAVSRLIRAINAEVRRGPA